MSNLSNLVMFIQVERILKGESEYNPTDLYLKYRSDKARTHAEFDKIRTVAQDHDLMLCQFRQVFILFILCLNCFNYLILLFKAFCCGFLPLFDESGNRRLGMSSSSSSDVPSAALSSTSSGKALILTELVYFCYQMNDKFEYRIIKVAFELSCSFKKKVFLMK